MSRRGIVTATVLTLALAVPAAATATPAASGAAWKKWLAAWSWLQEAWPASPLGRAAAAATADTDRGASIDSYGGACAGGGACRQTAEPAEPGGTDVGHSIDPFGHS